MPHGSRNNDLLSLNTYVGNELLYSVARSRRYGSFCVLMQMRQLQFQADLWPLQCLAKVQYKLPTMHPCLHQGVYYNYFSIKAN